MAEITELHDQILFDELPRNWPANVGEMHFRLDDDPTILGVQPLGPLDLSCDTGYIIRSYEFASPEMREVTYPNSLDYGNFDVTQFIGPRAVTLDMVLRNTPGADGTGIPIYSESQMRDRVLQYFHPSRRPILYFSEYGDWSSGFPVGTVRLPRIRRIRLRGGDAPTSVSQPRFNAFSMSWVAPEGVIEHTERHQAKISFTTANLDAEYRITTENKGSVPAHWRLVIDGDLETPEIELVVPGGRTQRLWLNYHVEEPGRVTIDSRTKTVSIDTSQGGRKTMGYRYLDDRSDWFRIPVGQSMIILTHSSIQGADKPYAIWQPAGHPNPADPSIPQWSTQTTTNRSTNNEYLPNPAQYDSLLTLKANATQGDNKYSGHAFGYGDYVILGDGTQAWYDGVPDTPTAPANTGLWVAGSRPNVISQGRQWVWSASIDDSIPGGNDPVTSVVTFTYHETFL